MDKKEIYNNYLNAINNSDLGKISSISSNLDNLNLNNFNLDLDWNSDVREILDVKVNDLKRNINTLSMQSSNFKNIVSYCSELKEKITRYNEIYNSITNAKMPSSLLANATEEEKTEYNSRKRAYDDDQKRKASLSSLVQEIEHLISLLKAINFENSTSTVTNINVGVDSSKPSIISDNNETRASSTNFNIEYDELLNVKIGDLNGIFSEKEREILSNRSALHLSNIFWQNFAQLSAIVATNMKYSNQVEYQVAVKISEKANPKFNKLSADAESAFIQQGKILNIYKDANHNGGLFTEDGYLRQAVKKSNESDIRKNIDELNGKIDAIEPIPLDEVIPPDMFSIVKGDDSRPSSSTNLTYIEGLFIETLYNGPRDGVILTKNLDSNNQLVGFMLTDNRDNKNDVYVTDLDGNVRPVN